MDTKWDIKKFIIDNGFVLWKVKMQTILIQQRCTEALKGETGLSTTISQAKKIEMVDKASSAIVMCLRDKVLREVAKETTVTMMCTRLSFMQNG